jgi:glutathione synthase/RimK-type ligase-like ATP-grasp enzyme
MANDSTFPPPLTALFAEDMEPPTAESFDVMDWFTGYSGRYTATPVRDKDTVLLVTSKLDVACDELAVALMKRGLLVCRLNVETLGHASSLRIEIDPSGTVDGMVSIPCGDFRLSEMRSAWLRRPQFGMMGREWPRDWMAAFAWRERDQALRGLFELLENTYWLNPPQTLHSAGSKLAQLRLAASLGLTIPKTLVTDDPDGARAFFEELGADNLIVKAFRGELGPGGPEATKLIYTRRLKLEDLQHFDAVRSAPCIFQESVPKDIELRVTIIRRKVFAAEIHSTRDGVSLDDWRRPGMDKLTYLQTVLPPEVEVACLAILAHWKLDFGAIDLVRRPDGTYVFLELNTHAEWRWIEATTELPITAAIVDALENPANP